MLIYYEIHEDLGTCRFPLNEFKKVFTMAFIGFSGLAFITFVVAVFAIGGYIFHRRAKSKYYGTLLTTNEVAKICEELQYTIKVIDFSIAENSDFKRSALTTIDIGDGFKKTFGFPILVKEMDWEKYWKETYQKASGNTVSITYAPGARELLFLDKTGQKTLSVSING